MTGDFWTRDVRLAWRGLTRSRGFAAAAVLTLALGMAGAASMFAIVDGILLRPLPMPESERLVAISKSGLSPLSPPSGSQPTDAARWPLHATEVELIREASDVFAVVAATGYNDPSPLDVAGDGWADSIRTTRVTGDFFDVLGVRPMLGRVLTRDDNVAGAEQVLVLTHGLWQRRYGGSVGVIGRRVTLGERQFTIVGVMPPDVEYPRGTEAWMTVEARATTTRNPTFQLATRHELNAIARLQAAVTLAQAQSALANLADRFEALAPAGAQGTGSVTTLRPLTEAIVGDVRAGVLVLSGAVWLVLLIACANVANLLLVRSEIKRSEMAMRAALGASRGRLFVHVFAESLLLSMLASLLALAVASGSLGALVALAPEGLPRVESIRIDGASVVFIAGLALVTTLLAGLVPALAATRVGLVSELQRGGRSGRHLAGGGRLLVAAQVALAVAVVASAGLVARSLLRLLDTSVEAGANRLLLVSLALPQERYADGDRHLQFLSDVIERLESAPAVLAATAINALPFSGVGWDAPTFTAEAQDAAAAAGNPSLNLEAIQPGYFGTFGVRIVRGRAFDTRDRRDTPAVAIVSADVAARTWPGQDPIGKRLKMGDIDSPDPWRTIVGVAAPARYRDLRASHATLYVPAAQLIVSAQSLVVQSVSPPSAIASLVRDSVRAVDPSVRVSRVVPFTQLLQGPLARPRFYAVLLGLFALSALMLAGIGLYAVMAASVRQRHGEIGVRLAVGATPADVHRMFVREGLRLAAFGTAAGLACTALATRVLRGLLYEIHPLDPATLLGAAAFLVATAALASYLPARTAGGMDPLAALRSE